MSLLDELNVSEAYELFDAIYKKFGHFFTQSQMPGFEPIEQPILESQQNNPSIRFQVEFAEDVHPKLLARFIKVIYGTDDPVPLYYTLYLGQDGRLLMVTMKTRPVSALESKVGLTGRLSVESLSVSKIEKLLAPIGTDTIDWPREIWAAAKAMQKSFGESVELDQKGGKLRNFD